MLDLDKVSLDPVKAAEGVWFEFYSGARLKINVGNWSRN